jgi:hypothetical protein
MVGRRAAAVHPGVDGRAAGERSMGESQAAGVMEWDELRVESDYLLGVGICAQS